MLSGTHVWLSSEYGRCFAEQAEELDGMPAINAKHVCGSIAPECAVVAKTCCRHRNGHIQARVAVKVISDGALTGSGFRCDREKLRVVRAGLLAKTEALRLGSHWAANGKEQLQSVMLETVEPPATKLRRLQ